MIAVLGGLGAALCWATGTVSAARASRLVGARSVLNWVMIVGFVVTAPIAAAAMRIRRSTSDGSATVATPNSRGGITAHTSGSALLTLAVAKRLAPKLAAAHAARRVERSV